MAENKKDGICFRMHRAGSESILAAADSELIGSALVFRKTGAKIVVSGAFYGMEARAPSELKEALGKATGANLIGARALKEAGFPESSATILNCAKTGRKIPHFQAVFFQEDGTE